MMRKDRNTHLAHSDAKKIDHSNHLIKNKGCCIVLQGSHPQWNGVLHLYEDGSLIRPGVDTGTYERIPQKSIILKWDKWPAEELVWDESSELYISPDKQFTLHERPAPEPSPEYGNQKLPQVNQPLGDRNNPIHCYVYEGLCNRINCMASAMATGQKIILHWSINEHCPVKFEDIFNNIPNVSVSNESTLTYPYLISRKSICWPYPRNIRAMPCPSFREQVYNSYRMIHEAMKVSDFAVPPNQSMAVFFRHHLPEKDDIEPFWETVAEVLQQVKSTSIHVTSDSIDHKQTILERINSSNIPTSFNECPTLKHDLDRSPANVTGMCKDLASMRSCTHGILSNNTRSTVPDSLRGYGIPIYYTYDDGTHRNLKRDDLIEHQPVANLLRS